MARSPLAAHVRARPRRAGGTAGRQAGQSLPEFAMTLPLVLLLVLFGVDFGRVFLGWVTLTNAVREGASYAAVNPTAWSATPNLVAQAEYRRLVLTEASGINCTLPAPVPAPAFPGGTGIGSPAVVAITCRFALITPFITALLGSEVSVTATSAFPIRTGTIMGVPVASAVPTPSPAPTDTPEPSVPVDPSASPEPGGSDPPADPSASPAPTPTPDPVCTVPNLSGNTRTAVRDWADAGFTAANLIFSPLVPPNYLIRFQSLTPYTNASCAATMTVTP